MTITDWPMMRVLLDLDLEPDAPLHEQVRALQRRRGVLFDQATKLFPLEQPTATLIRLRTSLWEQVRAIELALQTVGATYEPDNKEDTDG